MGGGGKQTHPHPSMLSHSRLLELVRYDPETGDFFRLKDISGRNQTGKITLKPGLDGYRRIMVDGKKYLCSRLAFFYMTKRWPCPTVDHIDRNRVNDCWSNLREATRSEQNSNRCWGKTGETGIGFRYSKFYVVLTVDGKKVQVGKFSSIAEAVIHRDAYRKSKMKSTSTEAYNSVETSAKSLREKIQMFLQSTPATCDEIEIALSIKHQTCSARLKELADMSLIENSGDTRLTRSGRKAIVWRVI